MTNINNIAGISVATSASNNNNQNIALVIPTDNSIKKFEIDITDMSKGLKNYCLVNGEEFMAIAKSKLVKEFNVIVNGETYTCIIDKDELSGKYRLYMWDSNLETVYKSHFDFKVMSGVNIGKAIAAMQEAILAASTFKQEEQDWADFLDMCDRKADIVSAYQTEIDGYVQDIIGIVDKKENIYFKMEAFAIKQIVKKIAQTEKDCYDAIMDAECDCFGTEIDLAALWNWYNNYGQHYTDNNFSREDLDLEDLIDALDYIITESDMPLGCDNPFEDDDWEEVLEECYDGDVEHFFQIFEEEFGYSLYDYPMYLWDSLTEFARTYVHYAYCA